MDHFKSLVVNFDFWHDVSLEESRLIAIDVTVDGLAAVASHSAGIASLSDERRLHRVEQTPIVVLNLAQFQEVLAHLGQALFLFCLRTKFYSWFHQWLPLVSAILVTFCKQKLFKKELQ